MLESLLAKVFGNKHDRDITRMTPIVAEINRYCQNFHELSDEELRFKTIEFKKEIHEKTQDIQAELLLLNNQLQQDSSGEEGADHEEMKDRIAEAEEQEHELLEEVLLELLPQAFAVVKEQSRRLVGKVWNVSDIEVVWDMIPFDVQLIGGIVLHEGKIAEMATKIRASRLLTYSAAKLADKNLNFTKEASMAKAFSGKTAVEVATEAIQIHGGQCCCTAPEKGVEYGLANKAEHFD